MSDREKVIKAIETHLSTDISVGCDDCTYENDGWCMTRVLADALALLKEQNQRIWELLCEQDKLKDMLKKEEAVEPKTDDAWPSRIKTCGACGTCLFAVGDYKPKYCSECGRSVKWE